MKSLLYIATAAAVAAIALAGCKTTEENYHAAYEKAIKARAQNLDIDSTVYGKVRQQMNTSYLVAGGDSVEMRGMFVSPTADEDGKPTAIGGAYGVVAGQFKTLFNARSLCDRLRSAGYESAGIVNTAEPYYYVVAAWCADGSQAVAALRRLEHDKPVSMRAPLPFILKPAGRR